METSKIAYFSNCIK